MRDAIPSLAVFKHLRQIPSLDAAFADTIGDQYNRAFNVAEQAEQRLMALTPPANYNDAVQQIITTGEMPDDFRAWLTIYSNAQAQHDAERQALQGLRDRAAGACWSAVLSHTPQLLGHLHQQLADLIDRARPAVKELGQITEAEDVVRAGMAAVNAFNTLDQCWTGYLDIRKAQSRIMLNYVEQETVKNCRSHLCNDEAASDANFANLDDVFPEWRERPGQPQRTIITAEGVRANPSDAPWPERGPMQLKWFIDHGAKFWVPTQQQLEQLHTSRMWHNNQLAYELTLTPYQREQLERDRAGLKPKRGPEHKLRDRRQHPTPVEMFGNNR
ncbi:hypothetical protein [Nocardia sp. NPDC049707]|uniref:hypothetical protein n=1 Tax=Nocardia sp. NPDC049707 TaxID=3154735 RepID=UPI00342CF8D4